MRSHLEQTYQQKSPRQARRAAGIGRSLLGEGPGLWRLGALLLDARPTAERCDGCACELGLISGKGEPSPSSGPAMPYAMRSTQGIHPGTSRRISRLVIALNLNAACKVTPVFLLRGWISIAESTLNKSTHQQAAVTSMSRQTLVFKR